MGLFKSTFTFKFSLNVLSISPHTQINIWNGGCGKTVMNILILTHTDVALGKNWTQHADLEQVLQSIAFTVPMAASFLFFV